jgi:hypothetical protein
VVLIRRAAHRLLEQLPLLALAVSSPSRAGSPRVKIACPKRLSSGKRLCSSSVPESSASTKISGESGRSGFIAAHTTSPSRTNSCTSSAATSAYAGGSSSPAPSAASNAARYRSTVSNVFSSPVFTAHSRVKPACRRRWVVKRWASDSWWCTSIMGSGSGRE